MVPLLRSGESYRSVVLLTDVRPGPLFFSGDTTPLRVFARPPPGGSLLAPCFFRLRRSRPNSRFSKSPRPFSPRRSRLDGSPPMMTP